MAKHWWQTQRQREGFLQTGNESASSLKPSWNDCLGLRGTVKENGGGPLQTSALPLGYGAGGNVTSRFTASSARVGARTGVPYLGALSNDDQNATLATMMLATTTGSAWIKIP